LCDCIQGEWRPTPARIGKLDRYLKEYLLKVQARDIIAGEAYAPYSLGLWVGIGAWWLKAFIHGLTTVISAEMAVWEHVKAILPGSIQRSWSRGKGEGETC
jgi:hypothetical protein